LKLKINLKTFIKSWVLAMLKENLNRLWSYLIVDELVQNNAYDFFLSPGHRNAPLVAAISKHPKCTVHVGIDERGQGYQALGFAKSSGRIPVLICTSGTALANYLPALLEAKKTHHTLFVLSADRPNDITMQEDNQTLEQNNFYAKDLVHFLTLGVPSEKIAAVVLRKGIAQLLSRAKKDEVGIHFNLPFYAPMDATTETISAQYLMAAESTIGAKQLSTQIFKPEIPNTLLSEISTEMETIFVLGPEITITEAIELRKSYPAIVFLIDVQSNAKNQKDLAPTLSSLDLAWSKKAFLNNPPKQIIHFGGLLVSKYFYHSLKSLKNISYWHFHQNSSVKDPANQVTQRVYVDAKTATLNFAHKKISLTPYTISEEYLKQKESFLKKIEENNILSFADLAFSFSSLKIKNKNLFLGNSTMIRAFEKYTAENSEFMMNIYANRGVSGIEGHIATGIGLSKGNAQSTVNLMGDISFLYDVNSLGLLRSCAHPQTIIVANNRGGGIFKMLNFKNFEEIAPLMTTPHEIDLEHIAKAYQIAFTKVNNFSELKNALNKIKTTTSHSLIEVIIDDEISMKRSESLR